MLQTWHRDNTHTHRHPNVSGFQVPQLSSDRRERERALRERSHTRLPQESMPASQEIFGVLFGTPPLAVKEKTGIKDARDTETDDEEGCFSHSFIPDYMITGHM